MFVTSMHHIFWYQSNCSKWIVITFAFFEFLAHWIRCWLHWLCCTLKKYFFYLGNQKRNKESSSLSIFKQAVHILSHKMKLQPIKCLLRGLADCCYVLLYAGCSMTGIFFWNRLDCSRRSSHIMNQQQYSFPLYCGGWFMGNLIIIPACGINVFSVDLNT